MKINKIVQISILTLTLVGASNDGLISNSSCPFANIGAPSELESGMAKTDKPRSHLQGSTNDEIHAIINNVLTSDTTLKTKQCEEFNLTELNDAFRTLICNNHPDFDQIYSTKNDNRQKRLQSLEEYEAEWQEEIQKASANQELTNVFRDGKCKEIVMHWVHHITEEARQYLKSKDYVLPQMPQKYEDYKEVLSQHDKKYIQVFEAQSSCETCHSNKGGFTEDNKWPNWPLNFEYQAVAYGAYPFWASDEGVKMNRQTKTGTILNVKYSSLYATEEFSHGACQLDVFDNETYANSDPVPCVQIMIGFEDKKVSYLYDPEKEWCCISDAEGTLTAISNDFIKFMTYQGINADYNGVFYSGPIHNRTFDLGDLHYWYLSIADGSKREEQPVEWGEGCTMWTEDRRVNPCETGQKVFHYREYLQTTFKAVEFTEEDFPTPDYCKTTNLICQLP